MKNINATANKGYSLSGDTYEKGRPTYPGQLIDFLFSEFNISSAHKILDLAAGTGKFTQCLLGRADLVALEPVKTMRDTFASLYPGCPILAGTAENTPFSDDIFDFVFVATAFHWFDENSAYDEMARILKPGGVLGLIWNSWDKEKSFEWLAQVREIIEPLSGDAPRYKTMKWKKPFEEFKEFERLSFKSFDQTKFVSKEEALNRMSSISFVSALETSQRTRIVQQISDVISSIKEDLIEMPYQAHLYWCKKR